MGCDIHMYKEKKVNGQWVTADKGWADEYDEGVNDVPYENRFTGRDYALFGLLADVRGETGFNQRERGLPFNMCKELMLLSKSYGEDGHSHSFMYLEEMKDLWLMLQDKKVTVEGMKDRDELIKLNESLTSDKPDYDLIYPYCASANISSYERFEVEVPASYKLSSFKELINMFDDVDGENHRIVFWFDN